MTEIPQEQANKLRRLLLTTGVVVTFTFWFPMDDPMNIPKMFVLFLCTAWIAGTIVVTSFYHQSKRFSLGEWALLVFVIGLLAAAVFSDVRYTAFIGAAHRNNGALSYLALSILALSAMLTFDLKSLRQFRFALLLVGAVSTLYGLLQTTGHDPFKWNLYYNAVIGTLGNPDFFSALVGVCAIATVWFVLVTEDLRTRIPGIVLLLLEIFIVKRGGSFQGLLAFAIGATLLILVKLWQVNRSIGILAFVVAVFGGTLVFMGLLNKGPVASLVYRASFQSRKDYWDAALGMFKAHPLAGVGLERFAENYPQFAPQIQIVVGQGTDNAHNVILQLLATGGLLVILPYLSLLVVIFWTALRAIKSSSGREQIEITALFSIWFALLLISFISIDNLGVTVWFWISGGALYAITRPRKSEIVSSTKAKKGKGKTIRQSTQDNSTYVAPLASTFLLLIVLVLMVPVVRTSGTLYGLSGNRDGLSRELFVARLIEVSNGFPKNAQTLVAVADLSLRVSEPEQALKFTKVVLEKDQRSVLGNLLSASANEMSKRYKSALTYRQRVIELDPWNTGNMIEIVKDYMALQDLGRARAMADKIAQLRPGSEIAAAAADLVKG